jgi:carotenoid cleavage dioxygenase
MAAEISESLPFHLRGNYAPVSEELSASDLPVRGEIPRALRGLYLRNGPNPKSGSSPHWFLGDGMVHGLRLEEGRAAWYRNRWVRTRALEEDAQSVSDEGVVDRSVALANTHVVAHAGRIFALVETSYPTELTPELETVGIFDYGGRLRTAMTAHPKLCPVTGELHFFGYGFAPPFLTYHRADAAGNLVQSEEIEGPGPSMMHDFAITRRHVLFMDLPIVFSPERLAEGHFPYAWSDAYGARLGVMPRGGRSADVVWLEIDPCYVFHPMNAFDDGDRVVLDVARYPELWRAGAETFEPASLYRFSIDLESRKVGEQALDERPIEFPRIDERRMGLPYRYGYVVGGTSVDRNPSVLLKYDLRTGDATAHDFGEGRAVGEGVFAPAAADAAEDEGWILAFVYDETRNGSDLVILDASDFSAPPVAAIRLPQRVPFGFHGSWIGEPGAR